MSPVRDDPPVDVADDVEDDSDSDDDSDSESDFEVDEKDMATIMQLESKLDSNPNAYDTHVQVGAATPWAKRPAQRRTPTPVHACSDIPRTPPPPLLPRSMSACCARTA